ncbi:MAG: hypothetical protein QOD64_1232 [Verrucomicrobiota bacterium]
MAKPSWDKIDLKIRELIADDKGYHVYEIHDNDNLRNDLRYDDDGLEALAPDINEAFFKSGAGLSTDDILGCLKVIGIVARIDEKPIEDFK